MINIASIKFLFITLFSSISFSLQQSFQNSTDNFYPIETKSVIDIDAITAVTIYNSFNRKKWQLSTNGLSKFKNILRKSKGREGLILKPGHLYMIIKLKNKDFKYGIYMYKNSFFLEGSLNSKSYSFDTNQAINWDKLK